MGAEQTLMCPKMSSTPFSNMLIIVMNNTDRSYVSSSAENENRDSMLNQRML